MESILGLLKSLKIRAQAIPPSIKGDSGVKAPSIDDICTENRPVIQYVFFTVPDSHNE
jgi:hypothetical protein